MHASRVYLLTNTNIAPASSPQGANINICPCHTHKGESCWFGHTCSNMPKEHAHILKVKKKFNSFDRRSWLYRRHVTLLPSTLQFEQSVKGKNEINSTLTNVNKVLSGQPQRIDSIKRANVPLACLSFNYITRSLLHILPWGQPILHHICVHMRCGLHVWVCVCMYYHMLVRVCVWLSCLLVDGITLHLLKWAALPGAPVKRPAAILASIDSSGLGLGWGSASPVAPVRWPTLRQSSGGESRVSSPGHRLGALLLPVEMWKCETIQCVSVCAQEHTRTVTSERLRFVQP